MATDVGYPTQDWSAAVTVEVDHVEDVGQVVYAIRALEEENQDVAKVEEEAAATVARSGPLVYLTLRVTAVVVDEVEAEVRLHRGLVRDIETTRDVDHESK